MDVKLEQYRVFNVTAQAKSISEAAQRLYITQSAVSQTIKQLEATLGTTLFSRTPRGISLTHEGEILYQYTSAAFGLIETGQHRIEAFKEMTEGELRIGASDTVASYYLLAHLEKFHHTYPNVKIQMVNRVTKEAISLLKQGALDLAFGNLPIHDDALEVIKCMEVHDIFVAPISKKEEYGNRTFTLAEIAKMPLLLLEKTSNSRNYVDAAFLRSGTTPSAAIELGVHELLLQFASINLGVACVTKEFSQKYIDDGSVFELKLDKPIEPRAIGCWYQKKIALPPAARAFLEQIKTSVDL